MDVAEAKLMNLGEQHHSRRPYVLLAPQKPWVLFAVVEMQSFWRGRYDTAADRGVVKSDSFSERFQLSDGRHFVWVVSSEPGHPVNYGFVGWPVDSLMTIASVCVDSIDDNPEN